MSLRGGGFCDDVAIPLLIQVKLYVTFYELL